MIIGDVFAWAHFPKTAGTTTRRMFLSFEGLVRHDLGPGAGGGHTTFADQRQEVRGKTLVMNFRRLPYWLLSYAHFQVGRGRLDDCPAGAVERLIDTAAPDGKLERYLGFGEFEVDRWLRVEHLERDFLAVAGDLTRVTFRHRRRVHRMQALNRLAYERDLSRWFTPSSLAALYERSPSWAELETELYGDILTLDRAGPIVQL